MRLKKIQPILALVMLFTYYSFAETRQLPRKDNDKETISPPSLPVRVFERNYHGFQLFRIPTLIKSANGTLLVFAEARKLSSNGDRGDIDLVLRRSADGGKTWGDMITIWNDGENSCGNPVPVLDRKSGKIHLLATWNNRRVYHITSVDNGFTWTAPVEITPAVKPTEWGFYGTGPVHGIQITAGPYKNRLVIPTYANVPVNGVTKHHSFSVYSDDGGKTWSFGNLSPQDNVGECTVVELTDGRLMLNMRSKLPHRTLAFSDDGGISWNNGRLDSDLIDPLCQASLLRGEGTTSNILFFSNPASSKRENLTIRMSTDQGLTWPKKHQVYAGPSAYSDMVVMDHRTIGVVFESGINSPHGHILFTTLPVSCIK